MRVSPEKRILNREQKLAVEHGDGPLLIIAGAGTGKTTVVTERITHLITSGRARPEQILALTFTEKASHEMEERVDMNLPYGATQMWISTFHAFCDRILRNEAVHIGLDPGFTLMTEAETIMFFRNHLFTFGLEYFRPLGNPTKFIRGMIIHFSRLKDEDISPEEYQAWVAKQRTSGEFQSKEGQEELARLNELSRAYAQYESLKTTNSVADYGDLISQTLRLFRTRITVLKRYQDQFRYLLIDEFQDTNFAQNELAMLLSGKKKNITVVGDDDQAIYRFRGAAVSNILQFRKRFPKTKIIVLTKNYRSTKEILDRSYDFIQHNNPDRLEIVEKIDKKLEPMRRVSGAGIDLIYADRGENEADAVGKTIRSLLEKNPDYQYGDVAVLVRANMHAEPFSRAFARMGIPYQFLGPGQLLRQAEVKDLIAYLKILYNFEDSVAVYRVLSMDWLGIPPRDLAVLSNFAKRYGIALFESCEALLRVSEGEARAGERPRPFVTEETERRVTGFVGMVHRHLGLLKKETAGQILYYFLQDSGLLQQLAVYKSDKEERVALNIAKFFNKLKSYEANHDDAGVFAVVDWLELSLTLGESPLAAEADWDKENAVNILTVHSAKGLEFPVVFMVNLVSLRFPTTERKEQIPIPEALIKEVLPQADFHLEEERRLFYVGMTRARDRLYFTAAKVYAEGKREKKVSPFIAETLSPEVIALKTQTVVGDTKQLPLIDWEKPPDTADHPPVRQPISYLSYSQLDTFLTCPLQYKYRYVIRIPVPAVAALSFGDTIHKTLHAFYERVRTGERPSVDDLLALLDAHWSSLGFGDKAYERKMRQRGERMLREFYKTGYDETRVPVKLEEAFKIKITPALTLGGKIDRVDLLPDGSFEIIDYKTGQAPKNRDVKNDLQLSVYALAATDIGTYHKKPEQVIVSFYFLDGQQKISATRTKEQLEDVKQKIAATADQISRSDFHPTPGKQCDFCEFRLICEAWQ